MTWRMTYHPPRFELPVFQFDKQRATCERCAHYEERTGPTGTSLTCGYGKGGSRMMCSSARLPDGQCGPDAVGFVERSSA